MSLEPPMDAKVQIALVIAVAVIVSLFIVRRIFTKGSIQVSKRGVKGTLEGNPNAAPPGQGVDLSEAEFKDKNKFIADNEARVKAQHLKAGSGNQFQFGSIPKPAENDKPEN